VDSTLSTSAIHNEVNDILALERISFDLVTGKMVDLKSARCTKASLLYHHSPWPEKPVGSVETAYRDALNELGSQSRNAITDATTALQQALELRHCDGELTWRSREVCCRSQRSNTLPTSKLIDWANADRGFEGDAHTVPTLLQVMPG